MKDESINTLKNIVEAAIMASAKAVSIEQLLTLFTEQDKWVDRIKIRQVIASLMKDYQSKGIELIEVSSGFRFQVVTHVAPWVARLWKEKPQKYSRALLETLALVAYKQPVTRGEIEDIRGVGVSSQIIRTLVDREWIRVIGYRDIIGKPAMYATTKTFLDYFSLQKLDELPTLADIRELDIIEAELEPMLPSLSVNLEVDVALSEDVERIDVNEQLNALRETYQTIDAIDEEYKNN
jgi:segregation and condensation protein B